MHKVTQCFAIMLFATAVSGGCATQSSTETVRKDSTPQNKVSIGPSR